MRPQIRHLLIASVVTVATAAALFGVRAVLADVSNTGLEATANSAYGSSRPTGDVLSIVGTVINSLLGLIGGLFLLLTIYGGYTWMTAQGSEDKVKKARNILSGAVIGFIIIFAAYAITQQVINAVANSTQGGSAANPAAPGCHDPAYPVDCKGNGMCCQATQADCQICG